MQKTKLIMTLSLGLVVSALSMTGCSSKEEMAPPPAPAPAPTPVRPAPPQVTPPPQPAPQEQRVPQNLSFTTIYFDYDKSALREDQLATMAQNAQMLQRYETVSVRLEGNCDERGTEEYNMALGQRRADAARQYLIDYGIPASRITTVSYGEMRPVAMGHTETDWARNRRVEIVITAR